MNIEEQCNFQNQIVQTVERNDSLVHQKCIDLLAETARQLIKGNGINHWPKLIDIVLKWAAYPAGCLQGAALKNVAALPKCFMFRHKKLTEVNLKPFKEVLKLCLGSTDLAIALLAAEAFGKFVVHHSRDNNLLKHFKRSFFLGHNLTKVVHS